MILSKQNVQGASGAAGINAPAASLFSLPEKVLQFGTGVLLRGLNDYFIDKANKQNLFNGRIVVVKSTDTGGTDAFATQDGLYTLLIKGIDDGQKVDEAIINASISRVVSAKTEWNAILKCVESADMQVIISNTTEVGISLLEDDKVDAQPPISFPGKLLAVLLHRYKTFQASPESGMVIIPTELIPDNGTKLKGIVNELAKRNNLDEAFIQWLNTANDFCNSLVDRIVPGKLSAEEHKATEEKLGYQDELMIMSECYRLWAIQSSSARTKEILSFAAADEGVVIVDNIDKYRELKLRLLNGSHTFSSGLACVAGFKVVKEAMADKVFEDFITTLMMEEIAPAIISNAITLDDARQFAGKVLDRYRNPYIEHQWISICMQYTSKLKMRTVPIILNYFKKNGFVPHHIALGFAAYILFMKTRQNEKGQYVGLLNGKEYVIQDDFAANLHDKWSNNNEGSITHFVLKDEALWGTDLSQLTGFTNAVSYYLQTLTHKGFETAIKTIQSNKVNA